MDLVPHALEAALCKDDVQALSDALTEQGLSIGSYYDWRDPKAGRQLRDPLSMAAAASAAACVTALLAAGADANAQSPSDGNTALHCACSCASSNTARVIALLVRGGADKLARNTAGCTAIELLTQGTTQMTPAPDAAAADDSDLLRTEYSTDAFRMFSFKIDCCPRLAESHDWTTCPFQHPGEKARRRDPRCHKYHGAPCPDFRKGTCKRGDVCTYAHGVFECWLHPSRYRTQLCKEGAACRRGVCFFAHSVEQLREPTMTAVEHAEAGSPRCMLLPREESLDTSRSWSPSPDASEDTLNMMAACAESRPMHYMHSHFAGSTDSSMSSTPVLEGPMSAAVAAETLQRTLSSLSFTSEDVSQVALQHVASGMPPHAALLAAAAAAHWPLQVSGHDALAFVASRAALPGVLLPDAAAVQAAVQAAAMHHQLSMLQQQQHAANTNGLMAAAGMRQPLHPLSINLGQPHYHRAPTTTMPSCFDGMSM